jgi:hypothetical protein
MAKCLRTGNITEKNTLFHDEATDINFDYHHKKQILASLFFDLTFENDIESWHITEKSYHAFLQVQFLYI